VFSKKQNTSENLSFFVNIYILELSKDEASKTKIIDVPQERVLCIPLMNIDNSETVPV
jgi:hypothetical protein